MGITLEASLEHSCLTLDLRRIDIVYVHDIGEYTHGDANADHMEAFLGSGYERLVRQKERGKIRAIGLGVNENQVCLDVMKHAKLDVILLAGRLTLLDRSAEAELVPACATAGTSLVLGGVFNSGILATGTVEGATYDYVPASPNILKGTTALQKQASSLNIPIATAALQFSKRHPAAASVLLGTAKPSTLLRNLEALSSEMPEDFKKVFL